MSRIVAGAAKSLQLASPAKATRPTSDRVRESVFAILESRDWLPGDGRVLDLFCGTGALALEALSRGMGSATLIDSSPAAAEVARKNLAKLGSALAKAGVGRAPGESSVVTSKVSAWLNREGLGFFDLIFCDPPYEMSDADLWGQLETVQRVMKPETLLIVERPKRGSRQQCPQWLSQELERTWGDTQVLFYKLR